MKSKIIVEEENTSSTFARSVLIARPKGMVVEVNDEDDESRASVTDGSPFVNPIM
jgi:hypothetical protein